MIINAIKLRNISSFKGEHTFYFGHTPQRTISVIFGENGAGKTSIHQALKLVLYGAFLFGNSKSNYQAYLHSLVRRNEQAACVELNFYLRTLAGTEEYTIKRDWQRDDKGFNEVLSILKGAEPLKELTPQFYQEYIFSIIPIGMMELFFFDGEKISSLGEALSSGEIGIAVKRLVGIAAIDDLEDAVRKYQLDAARERPGFNTLKATLTEVDRSLTLLHQDGEQLHQQYAEINEVIKKDKALLAKKEITFFETGGNLAYSHQALKQRQETLQQQLEDVRSRINDLSQGYLPLCVLSDELDELSRQLLEEREDAVRLIINEYAQEKKTQMEKALKEKGANRIIIKTALDVLSRPHDLIQQPLHGLSSKQTDEILAIIKTLDCVIRPQAVEAFAALDSVVNELHAVESAIDKAPDNSVFTEALSTLKDISLRLVKHERCLEDIQIQKNRMAAEVDALENKKQALLQQADKQGAVRKSDQLLQRFPHVLKKIKADLYERRIQTLQRLILQNVKALFRKNKLICEVQIKSDFSIELISKDNAIIDLKCLSAGEQQMLATAIQWALATLARGQIPTIIDTPLARLDNHHRTSLVQSYYPAMNQLILLSTDREIDDSLMQQLEPKISDIFYLKYNKDEECTDVVKAKDIRLLARGQQ